jgi:putative endonuclease
MVARNWRSSRRRGEIDLIGWDKDTLVFIEVKTRTARDMAPAEVQVDSDKRMELRRMAKEYLLRLKSGPPVRFDVMSVYLLPGKKPELEHFKNAFS